MLTYSAVAVVEQSMLIITVAGESMAAEVGGGEDIRSNDDAVVQVAGIDIMITESKSSGEPEKGPDAESSKYPSENSQDEVTSALGIRWVRVS
jgi:hypothetical protein